MMQSYEPLNVTIVSSEKRSVVTYMVLLYCGTYCSRKQKVCMYSIRMYAMNVYCTNVEHPFDHLFQPHGHWTHRTQMIYGIDFCFGRSSRPSVKTSSLKSKKSQFQLEL